MRLTLSLAKLTADRPLRADYGRGAPVLVTRADPDRYRLIGGPLPDRASFPGWSLDDPNTVEAIEAFASSSEPISRGQKMRLAVLLAPHLRAPAIAAFLNHRDPAEVWRWGALGRASDALRDAVLAEQLTMTHARPLLALPPQDQRSWVTRAIRGHWSVRQLTAAIRRESASSPAANLPASADIQALQTALGERLGTAVQVDWPEDPAAQRSLAIDWYDVESLKGILAQLSAGPEIDRAPSRSPRRRLVIALQNADELAALTGHLTAM